MKKEFIMDPKIDYAFKMMFSDETENGKAALISFINAVLNRDEIDKITDLVYLNPYLEGEYPELKLSIMDIRVKSEKGEYYDIEMQISPMGDFIKRSLYYISKMYGAQLNKGDTYAKLQKSIVICIMDYKVFEDIEEYHTIFHMREEKTNKILSKDFEIHHNYPTTECNYN